MKKRKILPCLIAALTITCFAGSCGNVSQVDDRVIVKEFGYSAQSMTSQVADVNNLEAVTELSSQVIKCEIVSLDDATVNEFGVLSFKYSVKILDIIMDINDSLEIGDTITVSSSEGIMKASEAAELMKDNATAKKLNILQGEYNDNEYITSSTWDAVPIEVGKTYIMFILPIGILNPRDYTLSPDGVSCSNIMVKRLYMSVLLLLVRNQPMTLLMRSKLRWN